jgi:Lon protease-like protein
VVLFPRTEIPLHIFEERYKEMIGECLENGSEFGIVLVLEDGLASTGCTASIREVIRRFGDGKMDILVRGQRRFELSGLDQEKSYLRGVAEFFDDEDGDLPAEDSRRAQALELYRKTAESFAAEPSTEPLPPPDRNDPQLSFQIASRLPLDPVFRQTLLQLRSEALRLDRTISYLQNMALRLTRMARAQARAGANGHSR